MRTQLIMLAAAALLTGFGAALAQKQTPTGNNTSGAPTSSHSGAHPQSTTPDRPPAAAMPEANNPSPESIGQAPAASEKMEPGMDTAGGPKTAPGEEKK
jgi:hypothetical protein